MKKVVVLERAKADFLDGMDFYERQDPGAGDYFAARVHDAVDSLAQYHGIHPRRYGLFCAFVPKFHHGILYRDMANSVEVVAIFDMRRNPAWIEKQLRRR